MARNVRIVPAAGGPACLGTEVWVGDELLACSRVELVADAVDGLWRVRIDALASIDGEIIAEQTDGA